MTNEPQKVQPSSSTSPLLILFIPIAFLLGMGAGYVLWGNNSAPAAAVADQAPVLSVATATETTMLIDTVGQGDPVLGPEDAPVTIIEFSDYQCPYCQYWHQTVFTQLMAAYPDQIRFVYRDLPIPGHPEAFPAAEAANCAGEQDAYWQFHDALLSGQYNLSRSTYEQYATDLGLDMEAFTACLDDNRYDNEIQADYNYAASIGVSSTPTFIINGKALIGAQPIEYFTAAVDEALAAQP
jgi:protein-disulfide isomerase